MKIERINENTLKFFISYLDIENLGFDREEIWYNRDRSEELFWQMMDEAHSQESFSLEGPLWIQVQALEKGMEVIVTRAQIARKGMALQLPAPDEHDSEHSLPDHPGEEQPNGRVRRSGKDEEEQPDEEELLPVTFIIEFTDLEHLIALSHAFDIRDTMDTALYAYKGRYYLKVVFADELPDEAQDDELSKMLEFGLDTGMTCYVLQEYGKELIQSHALQVIKSHFPLHA